VAEFSAEPGVGLMVEYVADELGALHPTIFSSKGTKRLSRLKTHRSGLCPQASLWVMVQVPESDSDELVHARVAPL
jgi:hypothetical protein